MPYRRRILHYAPGPTDLVGEISARAVAGAWFELHRQGGCGAGELRLNHEFPNRNAIAPGHWIAFDYDTGDRWYLGRVEHCQSSSPAGVTLRLEGMGVELNEAFPGGFNIAADGAAPHRYARTDLFSNDPDYLEETLDSVNEPQEAVALILQQYVLTRSHITHDPALVEPANDPAEITSLKFRGEETARSVIKELALRNRNASWGVDEAGRFFFLQQRDALLATWREGRDLLSLDESRDRETIYNRVLLTGDYVYDAPVNSEITARGFYRWRGSYIQPASRDEHGERRIRLWIPWIRTRTDSREFVREFFRVYAQPAAKYALEVVSQGTLPRPWLGRVRLEDRQGNELITTAIETIRVEFDHIPKFRLQLGPEDPHVLWPEPPHDERWEVAWSPNHGGDSITFPPSSSSSESSSSNESSSDASSNSLPSSDSSESSSSSGDSSESSSDNNSSSLVSSSSEDSSDSSSSELSSSEPSSEESSATDSSNDQSSSDELTEPASSEEDPQSNDSDPSDDVPSSELPPDSDPLSDHSNSSESPVDSDPPLSESSEW